MNENEIKTQEMLDKLKNSVAKEQTEEMCLKALEINWEAIQYIKEPTEKMMLLALEKNSNIFSFVIKTLNERPKLFISDKFYKKAVEANNCCLAYIPLEIINKKNAEYYHKKAIEFLREIVDNGNCDIFYDKQKNIFTLLEHSFKALGK